MQSPGQVSQGSGAKAKVPAQLYTHVKRRRVFVQKFRRRYCGQVPAGCGGESIGEEGSAANIEAGFRIWLAWKFMAKRVVKLLGAASEIMLPGYVQNLVCRNGSSGQVARVCDENCELG